MNTDKALSTILASLNDYRANVDNIRASATLSDQGKREQIALQWARITSKVDKFHADYEAARTTERAALERRLFNVSSVFGPDPMRSMAYRDALARAAATDDLMGLVEQAIFTGDADLTRAGLLEAVKRGDLDAVNRYVDHNPSSEPDLQRLYDLSGPESLRDVAQRYFTVARPEKPVELNDMNETEVREYVGPQPDMPAGGVALNSPVLAAQAVGS
ncbi:MAG: hypothetical protein AB7W59_32700 [Acidimicrobiia bacterium]